MHDKYAKDGLVILTVTLDASPKEKDRAENLGRVEKYLAEKKPPFTTVNLDFDPMKLPKTLNFGSVPGAFVFNREGNYVKKLPVLDSKDEPVEDFDYDVIQKAAEEALKKK